MLVGCNKKNEPESNNQRDKLPTEKYVSVESLVLSKKSYMFKKVGETLLLVATINPDNASRPNITWKSSNPEIATVSEGLVTCKSEGNVTITASADGKKADCYFSFDNGVVGDVCGNIYRYVKIGSQYWMAENMRCNKYDTQSERAGESFSMSKSQYDPCYIDASNKSYWWVTKYDKIYLSDEQISKLGYHYNWSAAVGLTGSEVFNKNLTQFKSERQGICPNGWHIPTQNETFVLKKFIEETDGKGSFTAGKHLKTQSGWNESNGLDTYGFSALPADEAKKYDIVGYKILSIGSSAYFWTSLLTQNDDAYAMCLYNDEDGMNGFYFVKTQVLSVRCVRNE